MSAVPEEHQSNVAKTLPLDDSTGEKVLGVYWEVSLDAFCMKVNIPEKNIHQKWNSFHGALVI